MTHEGSAYGLWSLVVINTAVFVIFAFSFSRPQTQRDWRSFGAFAGFLLALFAEMYGFPLTVYLLAGWIQTRYPGLDPFSHESGHLWHTLLGLEGDPHSDPLHVLSNIVIIAGFFLLSASWRVLHAAQQADGLAKTGPYASVRHPQYIGFIAILFGFLLQWPTLLTLVMFPVLVVMYVKLAYLEEDEVRARFGAEWDAYAAHTPRFIPQLGAGAGAVAPSRRSP